MPIPDFLVRGKVRRDHGGEGVRASDIGGYGARAPVLGGRRPFAFLNQELSRRTCSASTNRQGRTCRGRAAWRSRQWWTCGWKWRLNNMRKASCLSSFRSWWSLSSTAMSRTRRWWRRAWRSSSRCSTYTRPGCPSPSTWPGICVQALQVGLLTEIAEN
ncbi:unnamed protein product [Musa acuminata subsp. burmannicoides]